MHFIYFIFKITHDLRTPLGVVNFMLNSINELEKNNE